MVQPETVTGTMSLLSRKPPFLTDLSQCGFALYFHATLHPGKCHEAHMLGKILLGAGSHMSAGPVAGPCVLNVSMTGSRVLSLLRSRKLL